MKIGLDIGSTTIKCVVLNDNDEILHKSYERHYSQITEKIRDILQYVRDNVVKGKIARLAISGSAGMGVAENCRLPFVQEVFATRVAANRLLPGQRRHYRAGRRGCQNPVFDRRYGGADERHLRRRYRQLSSIRWPPC